MLSQIYLKFKITGSANDIISFNPECFCFSDGVPFSFGFNHCEFGYNAADDVLDVHMWGLDTATFPSSVNDITPMRIVNTESIEAINVSVVSDSPLTEAVLDAAFCVFDNGGVWAVPFDVFMNDDVRAVLIEPSQELAI